MAPAITHFLVGASLVLLFAAPFALRYAISENWALVGIAVGGLWGLIPDVHNISPVYQDELHALHDSPLMDLFALHYTLDRPLIRTLDIESTFVSILLFLFAISVFLTSTSIRKSERLGRTPLERLVLAVGAYTVASGLAGFIVGTGLRITGNLSTVAVLIGRDSLLVGGMMIGPLSLLGGILLAASLELGRRIDPKIITQPQAGGLATLPVAVGCWVVGVWVLLPLWLQAVTTAEIEIPYIHWGSLLALAVYSLVFGMLYATVRGAGSEHRTRSVPPDEKPSSSEHE